MTRCVKTTNKIEPDIQSRILTIRGVQVMLDRDLAELYQVPTKALNQTECCLMNCCVLP